MAGGCYGLQFGERPYPPFDKIAFLPPLGVCPAGRGIVHTITILPQP